MKIWLTTDNHFGHAKMCEYENRPINFSDRIIKGFSIIKEEDLLINLGDMCMGRDREMLETYIKPLKFKKVLVRGNHDKKSLQYYSQFFDFVCDSFTLNRHNKRILFSHIPQKDLGQYDINIHGHCHSKERKIEFEPDMNDKQKLLAIELTNYQPVLLDNFLR